MSQGKGIAVAGSIIGAIAGGLPGAIIGGLIGSVIQELVCPRCGSIMYRFKNGYYKCPKCGYFR